MNCFNSVDGNETLIDFEGTGAPAGFDITVALTDAFAVFGVNFQGPQPGDGGAILNQDSNFGIDAFSGTDFLAFNGAAALADGNLPVGPQTLSFDSPVGVASIWAFPSLGFNPPADSSTEFLMEAFLGDNLVDSDLLIHPGTDWMELSVSSLGGFDRVVLTEVSGTGFYIFDDLSFTAVPEPSSLTVLVACSLFQLRRRSRKSIC